MLAKVITNERLAESHGPQDKGFEDQYRVKAVNGVLRSDKHFFFEDAQIVDDATLSLVHSRAHVDRIAAASARAKNTPEGYVSLGHEAWAYSGTWDAARAMAGGCIQGVDSLLRTKEVSTVIVTGRSPGHHAEDMKTMGYCFLSNVALAATYANRTYGARIGILDMDIHQGNGTESIVRGNSSINLFDMYMVGRYQYPYPDYPLPDLLPNIRRLPLAAGTSGSKFLEVARSEVFPSMARLNPDLIVVSFGLDCMEDDPVGGFKLSPAHIREVVSDLMSMRTPLLFVMEGGYSKKNLEDGFQELVTSVRQNINRPTH